MAWLNWKDVPDEVLEQATDEYLRRQKILNQKQNEKRDDWGSEDLEELRKMGIKP